MRFVFPFYQLKKIWFGTSLKPIWNFTSPCFQLKIVSLQKIKKRLILN